MDQNQSTRASEAEAFATWPHNSQFALEWRCSSKRYRERRHRGVCSSCLCHSNGCRLPVIQWHGAAMSVFRSRVSLVERQIRIRVVIGCLVSDAEEIVHAGSIGILPLDHHKLTPTWRLFWAVLRRQPGGCRSYKLHLTDELIGQKLTDTPELVSVLQVRPREWLTG